MIDKESVQESTSLIAVCLLGAIIVAASLFIVGLTAGNSHTSSPSVVASSTQQ
jgi:hypothetical protein